jgi:hypothetical protein
MAVLAHSGSASHAKTAWLSGEDAKPDHYNPTY